MSGNEQFSCVHGLDYNQTPENIIKKWVEREFTPLQTLAVK